MTRPFADIQNDAEYLRAVGMGPDTHPELWQDYEIYSTKPQGKEGTTYTTRRDDGVWRVHRSILLALHDTDPARKWDNLANVLYVLGPEMDRRGFSYECFIENLTHTDLLEAFYNAHAQGDEQ